jgi:hypothetical protein
MYSSVWCRYHHVVFGAIWKKCYTFGVFVVRADRLLQERIKRNRSHQHFGDYDEAVYDGPLPLDAGGGEFAVAAPLGDRLVVVANRLPVTCTKDARGQWQLQVRLIVEVIGA